MVKELEDRTRTVQALRTNPLDDPQRALVLMLMAQERIPPKERIPEELHPVICEYSDYNEILTLFRMFPSPEDKSEVFGFESYEALNRRYQSRASKKAYLERLAKEYSTYLKTLDLKMCQITFDAQDIFIQKVCMIKGAHLFLKLFTSQ